MKFLHNLFYKDEYAFAAHMFRYAFALYFLLVGIKKLRMGIPEFATSLTEGAMNTELLANEIPAQVLMAYGYILPVAELLAGVLLLVNKYVREAYMIIGFIFLSFIFGQMYSGNTSKIGTDYLPSMVALCIGVFAYLKTKK